LLTARQLVTAWQLVTGNWQLATGNWQLATATGNGNGNGNRGTDAIPLFDTYSAVTSAGVAIDLPGEARSRPFVTDWTGDGFPDLLIGASDGRVHLYQGVPEPTALISIALAVPFLLKRSK